MISLTEDEWALCEYYQYVKDKKIPPKEVQGRYMEVMTKLYILGCDVRSDGKDGDED